MLEPADMLDSECPTDSDENSDGPLALLESSSSEEEFGREIPAEDSDFDKAKYIGYFMHLSVLSRCDSSVAGSESDAETNGWTIDEPSPVTRGVSSTQASTSPTR